MFEAIFDHHIDKGIYFSLSFLRLDIVFSRPYWKDIKTPNGHCDRVTITCHECVSERETQGTLHVPVAHVQLCLVEG